MLFKCFRRALILTSALFTAGAQTLSITPDSTALEPAGGTVVFNANATFAGSAETDLVVTLPTGWSYVSGSGELVLQPVFGASRSRQWSGPAPLPSPVDFSFTVAYPAGSARASVHATLSLSQTGGTTVINLAPIAFGPPGAPTILIQPAGVFTTISSAMAGFSVVATGTPPLSYQWYKDNVRIPGATNPSFSYSQAAPSQSGRYYVVVSNALGSVPSDVAILTVPDFDPNPGPVPPIIYVPPAATSAPTGGAAAFSVLVLTNTSLDYQWLRDGAPITGATGAALVLPNVQPVDAAAYSVIVKNAYGSAASQTAMLTVGLPPTAGSPPAIAFAPFNYIIPQGSTAFLSVAATGTPPLTYQWLHYGVPIVGATDATLDVATTNPSAAGAYRAVVSNALGAATSPVATVSFVVGGIGLSGFGGIPNVRTVAGGRATFTAPAIGSPPLTYQWYKDDFSLPGATAASLVFSNVIPSDAGVYRVVMTNPWGSTRYSGQLTVEAAAVEPSFVFQPLSLANTIDTPATISATVDGTGPFTFQWLKNGRELSGATSVPLVFRAVQPGDAGSYTLVVTNAAGTATSSTFTLTLRGPGFATLGTGPTGLPTILRQPQAVTARDGGAATFAVTATALVEPISYQWRKAGVALAGATGATYTLTAASAADTGDYSVVVWNSRGMIVSEAARLAVSGRSYAGIYFGTIVGLNDPVSSQPFCLYVRDDHAAVYLGPYADGRRLTIDDNGHFLILQGATSGTIAGANAAFSLEGNITAVGDLVGTYYHHLSGWRAALSATSSPTAGSTQALAGMYPVLSTANGSAVGSVLLNSTGRAFATFTMPGRSDLGAGTVDAKGQILITTSLNRISGTARTADGTLTVDVTPAAGEASLTLAGGRDGRAEIERVVNISTRATTGSVGADALIAGFVLAGTEPKPVLIRAIGPTLAQFGVSGALSAVRLELFRGSAAVASNTGWDPNTVSIAALIASVSQRVGAFALPRGSKDAVLLTTLEPGSYTAQVTGVGGASGVALVEVYDATEGPPTVERKVINLSTRAPTGAGENTLVAGFVVAGHLPKRLLLRGIGPGLGAFGVSGTLGNPRLQLYNQDGTALAANDDWDAAGDAAMVTAATTQAGAFALQPVSKDAALVINLPPGSYTVHLTGAGTTPGVALVEVYEVP
jgi:hypothetical protein